MDTFNTYTTYIRITKKTKNIQSLSIKVTNKTSITFGLHLHLNYRKTEILRLIALLEALIRCHEVKVYVVCKHYQLLLNPLKLE